MFYIEELNQGNWHDFTKIMPSTWHPYLQPGKIKPPGAVLGAYVIDRLVGTIAAIPNAQSQNSYRIIDIYFQYKYEKTDIPLALFQACEKKALEYGFDTVEMHYHIPSKVRADKQTTLIQRLLKRIDWDLPIHQYTSFSINNPAISELPWYQVKLPQGYSIHLWSEVSHTIREKLQTKTSVLKEEDKKLLDPFGVSDFDPYTSVVLCNNSNMDIVGWMINQKYDHNVLCFRRVYIEPKEREHLVFFPLLSNSISRFFDKYKEATFNVNSENIKMRKMTMKMFGGITEKIDEHYYCKKNLHGQH